jgi:hypothetical protein
MRDDGVTPAPHELDAQDSASAGLQQQAASEGDCPHVELAREIWTVR